MCDKTRDDLVDQMYASLAKLGRPEFLSEIAMPSVRIPVEIDESSEPAD